MTQSILIIDDDEKLAGMVADYLRQVMFMVEVAGSGSEGLAAINATARSG